MHTFLVLREVCLQLLCQLLSLLEKQLVAGSIKGRNEAPDDADDGLKQGEAAAMFQVKILRHPVPSPVYGRTMLF